MRNQNRRKSKRQRPKKYLAHHDMLTTRHMMRDALIETAPSEKERQEIRAMFDRGDTFILRLHELGYVPGPGRRGYHE